MQAKLRKEKKGDIWRLDAVGNHGGNKHPDWAASQEEDVVESRVNEDLRWGGGLLV
jgi:hypothetical protein